ncbi:MAG: radical SAM protein [Euryarchaeota archaeon]|nr:radical SAM protein [Euryarchaeota archaeon]
MRLLLVHPHFPYPGKDLFPLGLGYLAASVEDIAEVGVIDESVERVTPEKLREFNPEFVGITATTPSFGRAREIIALVRRVLPEARVIVGGTHATFRPEEALSAGVDVVVRGEGEETLRELLEGRELGRIRGISYLEEGEAVHNPDRSLIQNLDALPFPAWRYFPLHAYRVMSLISARGCVYHCAYCSAAQFWRRRVRFRSPRNVVEEVERLYSMGFRRLRFMDSTFTLDRRRALEMCALIEELGYPDLSWSCETRADHLDEELLGALKSAGCTLICLGVDSGAQEVLDRCRRGISVEQVREAILTAKRMGIKVRAYVTFGFPGESAESVRATVRLLEETKPEQILLSLATAYPGTELERGRFVEVHENWVRKFHGHGMGAKLYFPETLSRREYTKLGDYIYREVRRINRDVRQRIRDCQKEGLPHSVQ